jgi:hypothetical protein
VANSNDHQHGSNSIIYKTWPKKKWHAWALHKKMTDSWDMKKQDSRVIFLLRPHVMAANLTKTVWATWICSNWGKKPENGSVGRSYWAKPKPKEDKARLAPQRKRGR